MLIKAPAYFIVIIAFYEIHNSCSQLQPCALFCQSRNRKHSINQYYFSILLFHIFFRKHFLIFSLCVLSSNYLASLVLEATLYSNLVKVHC